MLTLVGKEHEAKESDTHSAESLIRAAYSLEAKMIEEAKLEANLKSS